MEPELAVARGVGDEAGAVAAVLAPVLEKVLRAVAAGAVGAKLSGPKDMNYA